MYSIFQEIKDEKICLSYLGSFNDEITYMLTGLTETNLEHENNLSKLTSKVSFLIAECFQNVVRHGVFEEEGNPQVADVKEFFQINAFEDCISLASANLIENKYVESIEAKINQVNALDSNALKNLYRDVLENVKFTSKGGASLGLIEMERKSGLPLKKHFEKFNDKYSLFFMGVEVSKSKEQTKYKVDILDIVKFYNTLVDRNILILYKGDFSNNSVNELIEMLNNNLISQKSSSSDKARRIISIIEVLQNASKHGKIVNGKKEGIFTIQFKDNDFHIECGNFIDKSKSEELEKYLMQLSTMSITEINTLYKSRLTTTVISKEGNCGLGLLDIARNSQKNFTYNFTETSEKEIFYSIIINLK